MTPLAVLRERLGEAMRENEARGQLDWDAVHLFRLADDGRPSIWQLTVR